MFEVLGCCPIQMCASSANKGRHAQHNRMFAVRPTRCPKRSPGAVIPTPAFYRHSSSGADVRKRPIARLTIKRARQAQGQVFTAPIIRSASGSNINQPLPTHLETQAIIIRVTPASAGGFFPNADSDHNCFYISSGSDACRHSRAFSEPCKRAHGDARNNKTNLKIMCQSPTAHRSRVLRYVCASPMNLRVQSGTTAPSSCRSG